MSRPVEMHTGRMDATLATQRWGEVKAELDMAGSILPSFAKGRPRPFRAFPVKVGGKQYLPQDVLGIRVRTSGMENPPPEDTLY